MEKQDNERTESEGTGGGRLRRLFGARRPRAEWSGEQVARTARGLVLGAAAWLFAGTPLVFSVNPLFLGLLAAAGDGVGWIFAGILLGLRGDLARFPLYAGGAGITLVFRLAIRLFVPEDGEDKPALRALRRRMRQRTAARLRHLWHTGAGTGAAREEAAAPPVFFGEPTIYRALAALLGALLPAVVVSATGGFAYYDLYGAVVLLLLAPTSAFLFTGLWKKTDDGHFWTRWLSRGALARAALLAAVSYCGRSLSLLGLLPVPILLFALTLYGTHRFGLWAGVVIGGLGGLLNLPGLIPAYLLSALLYAILCPAIGSLALVPSALASSAYLLLAFGTRNVWSVLPSLLAGTLAFHLWTRTRAREDTGTDAPSRDASLDAYLLEQNRNDALTARLSAIAGSFGGLSEVFRQLGECRAKPSGSELRELCDECYDRYCPDCPERAHCWGEEGYPDTMTCVKGLCEKLRREEAVSPDDLTDAMRARCPNVSPVLADINERMGRRTFEELHGARSEFFARSYDTIARLVRDVLREEREREDYAALDRQTEAVEDFLREKKIPFRHVCVSGEMRRRVQILGLLPEELGMPEEDFRRELGEICGVTFPKVDYDSREDGSAVLLAAPRLRATYVHASRAAADGERRQSEHTVCGDSLKLFDDGGGRFFALLCDGMGRGRSASVTSGVCSIFLERVLRAGVGIDTALRMLNQFLRARAGCPEEECSSTVDLFLLNLYSGEARFVKGGAVASYILRDGKIYRFTARTVPIGILEGVDVRVLPFEVLPGDRVVMFSDGVTDAGEEEDSWVEAYLTGKIPEDDNVLIDDLLRGARERGSEDDMTAVCIRVGGG